ncbi:MAG: RDD family protein [Steroidobacteraceae bacterium]
MDEESTTGTPAGILRRLAAFVYDALLVTALLFVATYALLPLTGGEAILTETQGPLGHLYHGLMLLLGFVYFALCWTRGGQTLGMMSWRIRLQGRGGSAPGWADAIVRYALGSAVLLLAIAGAWNLRASGGSLHELAAVLMVLPVVANWLWIAIDGESRSLLDLAGGMRVLRLR